VATVVAVVSLTGALSQRRQFFGRDQIATARHRMWPVVMSAANAKYGGDAFEELALRVNPQRGTNPAGR
jgi:hypothetical protein